MTALRDTAFFVDLEREVWNALVRGDPDADRALLTDDFLGVYPTGFGDAGEHAAQLASGSTVSSYRIDDARLVALGEGLALLAYRATYRRPGRSADEEMFVSSIWVQRDERWLNLFSQDTPADGRNIP